VVEAAFAACGHADVGASAASATHHAGEQEIRAVAAAAGCVLAALGEDGLGVVEGGLVDQRLVGGLKVLVAPSAQTRIVSGGHPKGSFAP
jgi:hypothetical protein